MKITGWILALVLGMSVAAGAAAPEINYITPLVNHWEPFILLGEGLDAPKVDVVHWAPKEDKDPAELLPEIIAHGLPEPPATPPAGSNTNSFGRLRHLAPQAVSGVMMGGVAVFWVRSPEGISQPYLVNRPRMYFLEYESAVPGQEIRLFGRPSQDCGWWTGPAARAMRRCGATNSTSRGTSTTSSNTRCASNCPTTCRRATTWSTATTARTASTALASRLR